MGDDRKTGIEAALLHSQDGTDYVLVAVRPDVLDDPDRCQFALDVLSNAWPNHVVVLASSTSSGVEVKTYRSDVAFEIRKKVNAKPLNWQRFSFA